MCSLSFCSKRLKDNVSIHKPPKDPEIKKKWFNFVAKTRENVSKLNTVAIRILFWSSYVTEDHYSINPSQFGRLTSSETDVKFRRTLKRGVVPSIYPTPSEEQLVQKYFLKKNSLGQLNHVESVFPKLPGPVQLP